MFNNLIRKFYTYGVVTLNPGVGGQDIGIDKIAGVDYELVKIAFGVENALTPVSTADPLPVTDSAAEVSLASIDLKLTTPTAFDSGVATVTTAGTRVQLASNTCKSVTVKAKLANTGTIYVGGATVAAANGFELAAGESASADISNTNLVYIDSSVNAQGISFFFVN